MGRGFIEYSLPAAGRTEFVAYSAFLTYRLPDGSELPVDQQPAWCPVCMRFVLGERLPSVAELEQSLAAVQARDPQRLRMLTFVGRSVEDETAELGRRIGWRRGRVNPPRCLECGCDRILPLPPGNEFAHPATGEPVVVASSGFASTDRWVAEFTPEGTKPAEPHAAPDPAG
ncbi:MAG: hypothetical protein JWO38_1092 [Gemmataceae bacterium]|nr:hypothetical protein [Gemmataceae bacterium]